MLWERHLTIWVTKQALPSLNLQKRPSKDKHKDWGLLVFPFKYISQTNSLKIWASSWLCWSWRNLEMVPSGSSQVHQCCILKGNMDCGSLFTFPLTSHEQPIPPHAPRHDMPPSHTPSNKTHALHLPKLKSQRNLSYMFKLVVEAFCYSLGSRLTDILFKNILLFSAKDIFMGSYVSWYPIELPLPALWNKSCIT